MEDINLYIKEGDVSSIATSLKQGVVNFNTPFLGERKFVDFAITIEDKAQILIGGISGHYVDKYVIVEWVWIDEKYRNKGLGKNLFKKLDDFTLSKNCRFIHLDTMEFQAKEFYQRFGFTVVSTLPNWFKEYDMHIMRKVFYE